MNCIFKFTAILMVSLAFASCSKDDLLEPVFSTDDTFKIEVFADSSLNYIRVNNEFIEFGDINSQGVKFIAVKDLKSISVLKWSGKRTKVAVTRSNKRINFGYVDNLIYNFE